MAEVNLLKNPGFETGEMDPWGSSLDYPYGNEFSIKSPGRTSTYAAGTEWTVPEDQWAGATLWQDLEPTQCAQSLEFWYKGAWSANVPGESRRANLFFFYDCEEDECYNWVRLTLSPEWTFFHQDLDTTKLFWSVGINVQGGYGEGGWSLQLFLDDFDLEACSAPPAPVAVGGVVIPTNTLALIAPWLALIGIVGCIGTIVVIAKKRR